MFRYRSRSALFLLALFGVLTISTLPALAGSASVTGTFPPNGSPTMAVIYITSPDCVGQSSEPVQYRAQPFWVETAGTYTLDLAIGSGDLGLYLMTAAFDPAAGFPACLAADNVAPIGVSFALAPDTIYFAVPFDDTFSQDGGAYTLTASGPGIVHFGWLPGAGPVSGSHTIDDGRINKFDLAAPYAVYCTSNGVEVWAIDSAGHGSLAFSASPDAVTAADNSTAAALVADGAGIRLYKQTSGELQVVGAPDFEGKVYDVLFRAFPCALVDTTLH